MNETNQLPQRPNRRVAKAKAELYGMLSDMKGDPVYWNVNSVVEAIEALVDAKLEAAELRNGIAREPAKCAPNATNNDRRLTGLRASVIIVDDPWVPSGETPDK